MVSSAFLHAQQALRPQNQEPADEITSAIVA